ncbi:hypothetical protein ABFS83_13G057900 [Erythranthe nasuta]
MRRTRAATEVATQRQSARGGPAPSSNLRTSSSDSDPPLHLRPRSERAPKLADGRSPRGGAQSHPSNPKKLGTRIADLESQLGLAQEELKSLKDQLVVSTDSSKKSLQQDQLDKKSKKQQKSTEIEEKTPTSNTAKDGVIPYETQETDVFEVPIEKLTIEPKAEQEEDEFNPNPVDLSEPENPLFNELDLKNDEISSLKAILEEKDNEMEALRLENSTLKSELDEKSVKISSAQSEINELTLKLTNAYEEAEKSKRSHSEVSEKLEAAEKAKEELENEMKMLRVQTEQWRKAADAAASVLSGGVDQMNNGRRISERCGSMDKILYAHSYEHVGGYGSGGYVGSPGISDDCDDVFGSEKRKGSSGMRMFGDLWKKKGQK